MKIPNKLPKSPKYEGSLCHEMTETEWVEYFKNREKFDTPMNDDEKNKILEETERLTLNGKLKEAKVLAKKIPMKPYLARCFKATGGLKILSSFNLYEAKLKYPDEF